MTSFSKLIFAGRVMIHLAPLATCQTSRTARPTEYSLVAFDRARKSKTDSYRSASNVWPSAKAYRCYHLIVSQVSTAFNVLRLTCGLDHHALARHERSILLCLLHHPLHVSSRLKCLKS